MKAILGSDHAGFQLRQKLSNFLSAKGYHVTEVGARTLDSFDYPAAADELVERYLGEFFDLAILICGSGTGICMRANRHPKIRAANCTSIEMARLAREHNDANVLCLGERIVKQDDALDIVQAFIETPASTEPRHQHRVELLDRNRSC